MHSGKPFKRAARTPLNWPRTGGIMGNRHCGGESWQPRHKHEIAGPKVFETPTLCSTCADPPKTHRAYRETDEGFQSRHHVIAWEGGEGNGLMLSSYRSSDVSATILDANGENLSYSRLVRPLEKTGRRWNLPLARITTLGGSLSRAWGCGPRVPANRQ